MEYALLIFETDDAFDARASVSRDDYWNAWGEFHQALRDAGVYVRGNPLERASTGTAVQVRAGTRKILDGPFAETKEQLGGIIVIETPTLDEAVQWATRCPAASYATVEVRPVDAQVAARLTRSGI